MDIKKFLKIYYASSFNLFGIKFNFKIIFKVLPTNVAYGGGGRLPVSALTLAAKRRSEEEEEMKTAQEEEDEWKEEEEQYPSGNVHIPQQMEEENPQIISSAPSQQQPAV